MPAAVVVELTHLATLYHDDVMDEAPLRRGAPSANARWDNTVAILTGDFLFARASDILADLGPEAVRIQARTFERLVTGQIRETVGPAEGADPVEHYLAVVADKTGSLIATSGRFGAHALRCRRADVVDVADALRRADRRRLPARPTTSSTSPASPPSPARPRAPTCARASARCPCCTCRRSDDPADARLRELLGGHCPTTPRTPRRSRCCARTPPMESARAEVRRWADDARDLLAPLPDIPARAALDRCATSSSSAPAERSAQG